MPRIVVPEADALLDREFPVLDRGFVRLVDYMGGDDRIVAAARVSYWAGTKTICEDRGVIHYLLKHLHASPFEQVILTFHAKMPVFVARQWVRHRTARLNEVPGRYSVLPDEFYLPAPVKIRRQSQRNKQGRDPADLPPATQAHVLELLKRDQSSSYATYEELLRDDLARELARINLPVSVYTQWYWQIDLHNLFHFLRLRLDTRAQYEIREYAYVMGEMAKAVAALAYEAFEEHVLHAVRLSGTTKDRLIALLRSLDATHVQDVAMILNKPQE